MKEPFEIIVKKHIKLVYFFSKRWVNQQALVDDIVQETFLKAMKNYDQCNFGNEKELKSWLLAICRNTVVDYYRVSNKNIPQFVEMEHIQDEKNADTWLQEMSQQEDMIKITHALEHLEHIDQEIIKLKVYEEMSFKEIGYVFDMSEGAIKMRFYRGISNLRETII